MKRDIYSENAHHFSVLLTFHYGDAHLQIHF